MLVCVCEPNVCVRFCYVTVCEKVFCGIFLFCFVLFFVLCCCFVVFGCEILNGRVCVGWTVVLTF